MNYKALIAGMAVMTLVGCGGSEKTQSVVHNQDKWTEQQVVDVAGLAISEGGNSYTTPLCDQIAVVLLGKNSVDLYVSAGDTIITNPDGTVGIKAIGPSQQCIDSLKRDLGQLT